MHNNYSPILFPLKTNMAAQKKLFSSSNIITAILVIFTVAMLIFPNFKALVIQGLMKVGLFQPGVTAVKQINSNPNTQRTSVIFAGADGNQIDTKNMDGKVVFINFWATWCPPCIAEMPSVDELYSKYKNNSDIVFILADADANFAKSTAFMKQRSFDLPVFAYQSNPPSEWFEGSLPTTVVLDKKGNIAYKHAGAANYSSDKFIGFIEDLLKQ
ncbi:MAG: TlpA family protein disulfide reductase [Sphingobacteriales bacterium]|nr:TlpA family protein disulfide reductase [Sphingobacteriales bacterium]